MTGTIGSSARARLNRRLLRRLAVRLPHLSSRRQTRVRCGFCVGRVRARTMRGLWWIVVVDA
eukprot:177787-Chlamydomonas_euryale.AAC.7